MPTSTTTTGRLCTHGQAEDGRHAECVCVMCEWCCVVLCCVAFLCFLLFWGGGQAESEAGGGGYNAPSVVCMCVTCVCCVCAALRWRWGRRSRSRAEAGIAHRVGSGAPATFSTCPGFPPNLVGGVLPPPFFLPRCCCCCCCCCLRGRPCCCCCWACWRCPFCFLPSLASSHPASSGSISLIHGLVPALACVCYRVAGQASATPCPLLTQPDLTPAAISVRPRPRRPKGKASRRCHAAAQGAMMMP